MRDGSPWIDEAMSERSGPLKGGGDPSRGVESRCWWLGLSFSGRRVQGRYFAGSGYVFLK
jgi:hypothetical protein